MSAAVPMLVCDSPKIITCNNFLTPEECQHFIEIGLQKGMSRAKLVGKDTGVDTTGDERTNTSLYLPHETSPITQAVVERISALVGIPLDNAEQIQLIHYLDNQFYLAHYDGWLQPDDNEPPPVFGSEQYIIKER